MKDLLELGKPLRITNVQEHDVGKICEDLVILWKKSSEQKNRTVHLSNKISKSPAKIRADKAKLQQALFNLIEIADTTHDANFSSVMPD